MLSGIALRSEMDTCLCGISPRSINTGERVQAPPIQTSNTFYQAEFGKLVKERRFKNTHLNNPGLTDQAPAVKTEAELRKELARQIHDGVAQSISSIWSGLELCKVLAEKDPAKLAREIDSLQELAGQAMHMTRTLMFELRPLILEKRGIGEAVQAFLDRRQKYIDSTTRLKLEIETCQPNGEISRQGEVIELAIFDIVKEAVNNAIKHARARQITVELKETPQTISIIIRDDGVGFEVGRVLDNYERRGSLGLINIRERTELIGGQLTIRSEPNQGTHIIVHVPKSESYRRKNVS